MLLTITLSTGAAIGTALFIGCFGFLLCAILTAGKRADDPIVF